MIKFFLGAGPRHLLQAVVRKLRPEIVAGTGTGWWWLFEVKATQATK